MKDLWLNEESDDRTAERLNAAVERMSDVRFLKQLFTIYLAANLLIWICILLFPQDVRWAFEKVSSVNQKISIVVLGFVLGLGMFLAYTGLRLRFPDVEEQNLDADVMATYSYQSHATRRWRVWLASAIFGVVNLLLMVVVDLWLTS